MLNPQKNYNLKREAPQLAKYADQLLKKALQAKPKGLLHLFVLVGTFSAKAV